MKSLSHLAQLGKTLSKEYKSILFLSDIRIDMSIADMLCKRIRDAALLASFSSITFAAKNKNHKTMTAAERYESVWNKFLVRLNQNPQICLSSFQEESHVYKRGMMRWMYAHGLTVREAKKRIRECQLKSKYEKLPPSADTTGTMFLPVTPDIPVCPTESADILHGVCFTFPNGTQVHIKHGSAQAVMSLLKLYQGGDLPCLD